MAGRPIEPLTPRQPGRCAADLHRIVPYSPEAEDLISGYMEAMRLKTYEEWVARTGLSPMYARTAEHAIKLALVAHVITSR